MKCTYCTSEISRGTGIMYVHRDGEIAYYCSNKCWNFHTQMRRKVSKKVVAQRSGKIKVQQSK